MIDSLAIFTSYHRGLLVHTIRIIMMDHLSIVINYHGRPLVQTMSIIMMENRLSILIKLSWQTAFPHYINYYDGLLCPYSYSGPLVRTLLIIMMDCLSILINYHDGLLVHIRINHHGRLLVCTISIIMMDCLSTLM